MFGTFAGIILLIVGIACFFTPQAIILNIIGIVLGVGLLAYSARLFWLYKSESEVIGNPSMSNLVLGIITAIIGVMSFMSFKIQLFAGNVLICTIGVWLIIKGAVKAYNDIKYKIPSDWKMLAVTDTALAILGVVFLLKPYMIMSAAGRCIGLIIALTGGYFIKNSLR